MLCFDSVKLLIAICIECSMYYCIATGKSFLPSQGVQTFLNSFIAEYFTRTGLLENYAFVSYNKATDIASVYLLIRYTFWSFVL